MDLKNSPEDFSSPRIGATPSVGSEPKMGTPTPSQSFQSFMQGQASPLSQAQGASLSSPFDLPHQQVLPATPTFDTLLTQVNAAHATLGDISTQLNTPNLKLKQSSKYLLKNKLSDANDHIYSASIKLGLEPPEATPAPAGPFGKFIGMITNGQNQLQEAQKQLQSLKDKGSQLSPADMLLVQVKLNLAQQELEYSSVVLSKAIDDLKMLFNVQL
jgi:hypothetical protein